MTVNYKIKLTDEFEAVDYIPDGWVVLSPLMPPYGGMQYWHRIVLHYAGYSEESNIVALALAEEFTKAAFKEPDAKLASLRQWAAIQIRPRKWVLISPVIKDYMSSCFFTHQVMPECAEPQAKFRANHLNKATQRFRDRQKRSKSVVL